jgi:hypothetical protein
VRRWLSISLLVVCLPLVATAQRSQATALDDVEAAFARIPIEGERFTADTHGLIPRPSYRTSVRNWFGLLNHFQGIQRLPGTPYIVMSGANPRGSKAELFVVRLDEDGGDLVTTITVDTVMTHAGGLSVEENILAVPVHGGTPRNAKVVFYDMTDPEHPLKLPVEIDRPGRKASAAAFSRLANGYFLVAVMSSFDGLPRRIDFYLSRGPALADGFVPQPVTWPVGEVQARPDQERTFSHFQTINFVRQTDGRLYLVGFHNRTATLAALPGRDYADLYEVIFPRGAIDGPSPILAKPSIVKASNHRMRCEDGYCNMDAAAGLYLDPQTGGLSVYAAPGWLKGDTVKLTLYKGGS